MTVETQKDVIQVLSDLSPMTTCSYFMFATILKRFHCTASLKAKLLVKPPRRYFSDERGVFSLVSNNGMWALTTLNFLLPVISAAKLCV